MLIKSELATTSTGRGGQKMTDSNPMELFEQWLAEARRTSGLSHPAAFCLSTVDERGYPDARYVDLKKTGDKGFLFGTRLDSPKARAIARDPRVGMTFWWDRLERQVRIIGVARRASNEEADGLFQERSHEARAVTVVSQQSEPLPDPEALMERVESELRKAPPLRPEYWGAFWIDPVRIEFLRVEETRLHERCEFVRDDDERWVSGWLHP
jgi:pyridoxamine 5'-phosphate oxidase